MSASEGAGGAVRSGRNRHETAGYRRAARSISGRRTLRFRMLAPATLVRRHIRQPHNDRFINGRAEKPQQVGRAEGGLSGIIQRMEIHPLAVKHLLVKDHGYAALQVVDYQKRRTDSGVNASTPRRMRKTTRGAPRIFASRRKSARLSTDMTTGKTPPLAVLDEQALALRPGILSSQARPSPPWKKGRCSIVLCLILRRSHSTSQSGGSCAAFGNRLPPTGYAGMMCANPTPMRPVRCRDRPGPSLMAHRRAYAASMARAGPRPCCARMGMRRRSNCGRADTLSMAEALPHDWSSRSQRD
jgi:hypothetical protein